MTIEKFDIVTLNGETFMVENILGTDLELTTEDGGTIHADVSQVSLYSKDKDSHKFAEIALEREEDYIQYMADRFGGTY